MYVATETPAPDAALDVHLRQFFDGHRIDYFSWRPEPIRHTIPDFSVGRIAPGPKSSLWVYVSRGSSNVDAAEVGRLEFSILASEDNSRFVELLAMTASYHLSYHLGVGHVVPIGEPWLPGSLCDHMLVSRPYPFGPDFELCPLNNAHIHILWLLPITSAERDLKAREGLEALESRFEECGLRYWEVDRASLA